MMVQEGSHKGFQAAMKKFKKLNQEKKMAKAAKKSKAKVPSNKLGKA